MWEDRAYDCDFLPEFVQQFGAQVHTAESTISEIFQYFISDNILQLIVNETNRYLTQLVASKGGIDTFAVNSRARKWVDLTIPELKAFLSIVMVMGLEKRGNYDKYWSTHWAIEMPGFRSILSRDRFMSILQYLHLCNNEEVPRADNNNRDRLFKVRTLLDHILP